MSKNKGKIISWAPTKLARAMGLKHRDGRSSNKDDHFKPSSSSQNSGSFTEKTSDLHFQLPESTNSASELYVPTKHEQDGPRHSRSMSGHSRSHSGRTSNASRIDTFDKMAQSLESVAKAVSRLQSKSSDVLQRQRTIENRALNISECQRIASARIHKSFTELISKVNGLESEMKGMRVLWMCSHAKKSQLAMLLFSQGILSKYEEAIPDRYSRRNVPKSFRKSGVDTSLLVLMLTSLLSLVIALCRARIRSLPHSVHRALRCVQEVCKASCFMALGSLWDVFREILLMIVKWLGLCTK